MSEIQKIPKNRRSPRAEPKIVGARPIPSGREAPKTLDQRSKAAPVEIQTTQHGEVVTVQSHTRSKPQKKDEPEVRIRTMTEEEKQAWDNVKTSMWEDS